MYRPLFSQTPRFQKLKEIIKEYAGISDFEHKWQKVVKEFSSWELSEPARNTSDVNIRLHFLERVCVAFPEVKLNTVPIVVESVLSDSGVKNVGDAIRGRQPDGTIGTLKIVRREITDRFGILYTLETQDGLRFAQEFFD